MNISTQCNFPERQRGVSLPVALILLVPLTLLSVTLATRSNLEELMAGSHRDGQQSLMNAESGLAMGQQALGSLVLAQVDKGTGLTVNDTLTLADPYAVVSYGGTDLSNYSLPEGTVTVVVLDNDDGDGDLTSDTDGRVILRSIGSHVSGERMVEAIVELNFIADPSGGGPGNPITIFTEDRITLSSTAEIRGPALVHSNDVVEIGGEVYVEGEIQNVGSRSDGFQQLRDGYDWPSGYAKDSTSRFEDDWVTPNAAPLATPFIYPPYYKGYATRYLTKNCEVWNGVPNTPGASKGWPKQGWVCSSGDKWELKGTVDSHFYYVESHVMVPDQLGSEGNPLEISIVSEGYMDVSGQTYLVPYPHQGPDDINQTESDKAIASLTAAEKDAVLKSNEVLLLAGGDLKVQGQSSFDDATAAFSGLLATHDQLYISGTTKLHGGVLAENRKYTAYDSSLYANVKDGQKGATEQLNENVISGELFITGGANMGGAGEPSTGDPLGANLKGWREAIE